MRGTDLHLIIFALEPSNRLYKYLHIIISSLSCLCHAKLENNKSDFILFWIFLVIKINIRVVTMKIWILAVKFSTRVQYHQKMKIFLFNLKTKFNPWEYQIFKRSFYATKIYNQSEILYTMIHFKSTVFIHMFILIFFIIMQEAFLYIW